MTKNDDLLSGTPDQVLNRLLNNGPPDTSAAALIATLVSIEEDLVDGGWDQSPALYTCSRNLPPRHIADGLARAGSTALVMELREIPGFPDDAPPYVVLNGLAEMLNKTSETARLLLHADKRDICAWVFCCEGWGLIGSQEDVENRPTKSIRDDPRRIEVRIITAVDRAGYRYQLTRRRDTDLVELHLDKNPSDENDEEEGLHGRILDALAGIMRATPAESES